MRGHQDNTLPLVRIKGAGSSFRKELNPQFLALKTKRQSKSFRVNSENYSPWGNTGHMVTTRKGKSDNVDLGLADHVFTKPAFFFLSKTKRASG